MLVLNQNKRNTSKECYDQIRFIQSCVKDNERYKYIKSLKASRFNMKYLAETKEGTLNEIRLINSFNLDKEHVKEVLKEAIVLTRINCSEMIQSCTSYFIQEKQLFVVMDHFEVEYNSICLFLLMKSNYKIICLKAANFKHPNRDGHKL